MRRHAFSTFALAVCAVVVDTVSFFLSSLLLLDAAPSLSEYLEVGVVQSRRRFPLAQPCPPRPVPPSHPPCQSCGMSASFPAALEPLKSVSIRRSRPPVHWGPLGVPRWTGLVSREEPGPRLPRPGASWHPRTSVRIADHTTRSIGHSFKRQHCRIRCLGDQTRTRNRKAKVPAPRYFLYRKSDAFTIPELTHRLG